jgi:hypothetical protein
MQQSERQKPGRPRYVFEDGAPFRVMVAAGSIVFFLNEAFGHPFPPLIAIVAGAIGSFFVLFLFCIPSLKVNETESRRASTNGLGGLHSTQNGSNSYE